MNDSLQSNFYVSEKSYTTTQKSADKELHLLDDEIVSSYCDDCYFYFQFAEKMVGKIFCTNFRLCFVPAAPHELQSTSMLRSKVIDDLYDIPLCAIHSVYYSLPGKESGHHGKGKFVQLTASVSSMIVISCIKIYLKDFRVAMVDLQNSQNASNLANQILLFSRPKSVEHMIQNRAFNTRITPPKLVFNDAESWQSELARCGQLAKGKWKTVALTREGLRVDSYPMHIVVPTETVIHEINTMINNWRLGRLPIWMWSHSNGCSILRSSMYDESWISTSLNTKMCDYVGRIHPNGDAPYMLTIDSEVSPTAISTSFDSLLKLCAIDSMALYTSREKDWFARLSHTGWLRLVSYCLRAAADSIDWLVDRRRSIIIYEDEGRDVSAVVSSLVQICCDRYYRDSAAGLESLIWKEWIAVGHPFGQRILRVGNDSAETTPTFLLFLDCLSQLVRLYPMQFCYSHHVLIALWDVTLTGAVPSLACSSASEQLATQRIGGPFPLAKYYHSEYTALFSNQLHDAAHALSVLRPQSLLLCEIIRPPTQAVDVLLWSECYLRWIPAANVTDGGDFLRDAALDHLMSRMGSKLAKKGIVWTMQPALHKNMGTISSAYPYSQADVRQYAASPLDTSDSVSLSSFSVASYNMKDKKNHRNSLVAAMANNSLSSDGGKPTEGLPSPGSPRVLRTPTRSSSISFVERLTRVKHRNF